MILRPICLAALAAVPLLLTACERKAPERPSTPASSGNSEADVPAAKPADAGAVATSAPEFSPKLDIGALNERKDPDRVLRFYAAALNVRDWGAAAKAWGQGSGVTAATLKSSYDRSTPPTLELGKGEVEGAAGSLYYEAPVTLRFGAGMPEHGSLVLRRVNDVDGATPEQLRWHIERSTIGEGE